MKAANISKYPLSYYAASCKKSETFSELQDSHQVDVAVVGGGYSGLSTAIELAERGKSVALLEANQMGWGASGRNGGQLIRGLGHNLDRLEKSLGASLAKMLNDMGSESVDIVRERIKKYQIDCDLKWGFCRMALHGNHMRELEKEYQSLAQKDDSGQVELLDKTGLKAIIGSERFFGGMVDMKSGHLHPLKLALGEARVAASLGVKLFEHSAVYSFEQGTVKKLRTQHGEVNAKEVVFCCNGYHQNVFPKLARKVLPASSFIIATEPLSENVWKSLLPGDHAICDKNAILDYFRLSADKRLLFGSPGNYFRNAKGDITSVLMPKMLKVFPQLENVKIEYSWGGEIAIGANRIPQIGEIDEGIWYAQGYSGFGVSVSHLAGRLIAEAITGDRTRFDIFNQISHLPIPGNKKLRAPMVAAGMLFHKLIDIMQARLS